MIYYTPRPPSRLTSLFEAPWVSDQIDTWACSLGRAAVFWSFRGLDLPPQTTVWAPAFHCGLEVQAILDAGSSVAFYRVRDDLTVDEADLIEKLESRPGPVMLTHFFGRGQPGTSRIAHACRQLEVPLVEDCCHALYSSHEGRPLGTTGITAAFSYRKTLGTLDGALVRHNREGCGGGRPFAPPVLKGRARWPYRVAVERLSRRLPLAPRSPMKRWARGPEDDAVGVRASSRVWRASDRPASPVGAVQCDARPDDIVRRRRANWSALLDGLRDARGLQPLWTDLRAGECPLGFVARVRERATFLRRLEAAGVSAHVFGAAGHPAFPEAAFPDARRLRNELVCLPAHHALDGHDVHRIVEGVRAAY